MKILENIKKGILQGIGILFILSIAGVAYATISNVNTGDALTATIWNELVGQVNQNTTNISTNTSKLTNITNNGTNVGIGVPTPNSKLEIDSGDIRIGGYNVISNIGSAVQNNTLTVGNQTWTSFPGATKTFNLVSAKTVKLSAYGSVMPSGGTGNAAHCGFRFYIDGAGYGQVTWGDEIIGCATPSSGVGYRCPWNIEREINLGAGSHTVSVQMIDWGVSYPACYTDANDYSKARLFIEAY